MGRTFSASEASPGGTAAAIITYAAWQRYFGGDPEVLGRTLDVGPKPLTIVGVLRRTFQFPVEMKELAADVLTPLVLPAGDEGNFEGALRPIGRLKRGVSIEVAAADLTAVARRMAAESAQRNRRIGAYLGAALFPLGDRLSAGAARVMNVGRRSAGVSPDRPSTIYY